MGVATTSIYLPLVRTPMILPTLAYLKMPAMQPEHVAKMIGKAIYTRRHTVKPWWLIFGQLASVMLCGYWDKAMPSMLRKKEHEHEHEHEHV
ncbi:Fatty acyl-CoA reductase [compost metagenome]